MFMARKLLDFQSLLSLYITFLKKLSNQKKKGFGVNIQQTLLITVTNIFQELKLLIFSKINIYFEL